jgi:hypothetical protein
MREIQSKQARARETYLSVLHVPFYLNEPCSDGLRKALGTQREAKHPI